MSNDRFGTVVETAPSDVTEVQVSYARTIGLTGLFAVILGILVLTLNEAKAKLPLEIGNNVGFAGLIIGLAMMFYHAARDGEQLIRRLYGYVGGLGLPLCGLVLSVLPLIITAASKPPDDGSPKVFTSKFFPFGWACFLSGLFYLMPFCRLETEAKQRSHALMSLGGIGIGLAAVGILGSLFITGFAVTFGSVLSLLGLGYLCAFVAQKGGADLDGYRPAVMIGAIGVIAFLGALTRSVLPGSKGFFVPTGLIVMALGLCYALTSALLVSEWKLVVLTRRELAAYFYSPIAYILVFISALVAWLNYNEFVFHLLRGMLEPVVLNFYFITLNGVFMLMFVVPALTMRSFSEEKRTGTYEVLMCAPVSDVPVVVSKLLAAIFFYMLIWAVWLVVLLDVRLEAGTPFEFRPLISFHLVLAVTGSSFLAMGVFFSSLTRNQIVAAAASFVGMLFWVGVYFIVRDLPEDSTRHTILYHLSFVNLWAESLNGRLHVRDIVIQLSFTVFWCFLTVKVLEARRWT